MKTRTNNLCSHHSAPIILPSSSSQVFPRVIGILLLGFCGAFASNSSAETIETDLLIVGGNESACAAAVQAARLGVKRIVLVNDIDDARRPIFRDRGLALPARQRRTTSRSRRRPTSPRNPTHARTRSRRSRSAALAVPRPAAGTPRFRGRESDDGRRPLESRSQQRLLSTRSAGDARRMAGLGTENPTAARSSGRCPGSWQNDEDNLFLSFCPHHSSNFILPTSPGHL